MAGEKQFEAVVEAFFGDLTVSKSKMFGSQGLKVGDKYFGTFSKGRLVVKLPKERVAALVAAGQGEPFDPGSGRIMKEWVAVGPQHEATWVDLAKEAKAFVEKGKK